MKNIKKGIGTVAAAGLISILSMGSLSNVALAADLSYTDPQNHKESMTIGGDISVINHNDINNDGLVNAGDTFDLNLHIENTSDNDYNHVDVSSFGLGLDRTFVSDSLPAGDSLDYAITYEIKENDTLTDMISHNVFVNVRDETRIENSTRFEFVETVDQTDDIIQTYNSKLVGLIMDKASGNIIVSSLDEYDNYYGIDESRLSEGSNMISVGDGFVYTFDFTNDTEETITLDSIEYVDNIIEENISGTVVEPGETVNLYAISEITRDDLDWGIMSSKATVGGGFDIIVSDANNVNYIISNGKTTLSTSPAYLTNWGYSNVKDLGGTAESNITYNLSTDDNSPTVVVDGINSERFGFIESSHVIENSNEIVIDAPETIALESGDSFTENAFTVYRGKYNSLYIYISSMEITGSYSSDTGGGIGDEFPPPTLNEPVCGEEAQVVLPQEFIDKYNETNYIPFDLKPLTYEVEKQDDNTYYVYAVDWNFPLIVADWTLEIPDVVPCPVEAPDYEEPVFTAPTCDTPAYLTLPENNEFYNYSSAGSETADGGVFTAEVRDAETDELLDSWEYKYEKPTDCDPIVEIPDYEVPTFVPGTCDTDYVLNVPKNTEHYTYASSSVSEYNSPTVVFEVQVYSNETNEMLDSWTFEYILPTDCDPVVEPPVKEETPEPPVEESVPPVITDPEPPIKKDVPKKINSGEVSEIVEDNNAAVFALIAGAGMVVALTTGFVLVRSRKK